MSDNRNTARGTRTGGQAGAPYGGAGAGAGSGKPQPRQSSSGWGGPKGASGGNAGHRSSTSGEALGPMACCRLACTPMAHGAMHARLGC